MDTDQELITHWACGRVDCNCDMITNEAMDNEQRDNEVIDCE